MVRPVARFRPAARRTGGGLVPVFFTRPTGTPGPLTVRTGSQSGGIVKELNIYDDAPRTLAPTASRGVLELLKEGVGVVNADTVFYAESETITEEQSFSIIRQDVIDGVAYVLCLRLHQVRHTASVTYQLFDFQGLNGGEYGPISGVLTDATSAVLDAICDAAVFAVDLETGEMSASAKVIYEYEAIILGLSPFYAIARNADEWIYPVALAFSELLPTSHPFKDCGALAWGSDDVEIIQQTLLYQEATGALNLINPKDFSYFRTQMWVDYSALRALNTVTTQRLIISGSVFELSSYQSAYGVVCELYKRIGVLWFDSFSGYDPEQLQDRESVFVDLSGLSQSDQQLFLQTNLQPPALVQPGFINPGTTLDPVFFLAGSSAGSLSFAVGQILAVRYWIVD